MVTAPVFSPNSEPTANLHKRIRRILITFSIVISVTILSMALLIFLLWRKTKTLEAQQKELQFGQFVTDYNNSNDFIEPKVNTIQFLRRGYRSLGSGLLLPLKTGIGTRACLMSSSVCSTRNQFRWRNVSA